jgi:adenine deaminase
VLQTYTDGVLVAENGTTKITTSRSGILNNFDCSKKILSDLKFPVADFIEPVNAIEALDGQLITNNINCTPIIKDGYYEANIAHDILKIVVVNRYTNAPVAKSFIKNFGLQQGAIASSVAHDSHNIVAVGVDDENLLKAINLVVTAQGGVSAVSNTKEMILALPVAGLMSNDDGYKVATAYTAIDKMVKEELGSSLTAPFMTLSFMALLVIPHLKLSDRGLFDGDKFEFV